MNFDHVDRHDWVKALKYIVATGNVPLDSDNFIEDFDPIGDLLLHDMTHAGHITIADGGITIVERNNG